MAIDKAIPTPLFSEISSSMSSVFFHVFPGEIAFLQGYGFMDSKARPDSTTRKVEQVACLESILFREGQIPPREQCESPVLELSKYSTEIMAQETVRVNGCTFSISKCNNTMLLNIPGSYRFVMNDGTAIGNARIYLRIFSKDEFPWNSKFMIGA